MFNGLKIKQLLEDREIKQSVLIKELDISKSNLYVWINGTTMPGADKLELIADFFKVPIDYFFDRKIETPSTNIGHHVNGNGNKVSGDITLSECQKEIEHLKELLAEKERTIQILMKQTSI